MRTASPTRVTALRGLAALVAVAACGLPGCRSAAGGAARSSGPVSIDVGSGDAAAVARRSALELADAGILAERAPRVGGQDGRYVLRFEGSGRGAPPAFQALLRDALIGTGRFLVVAGGEGPAIRARVSVAAGGTETRVELLGPDGDLWAEASGRVRPAN